MTLKFVTLNVWIGGVLLENIIEFLRQEDADVVVLQEVLESTDPTLPPQYRTIESLQKHLDYPYTDFAPIVLDDFPWGKILNGNAVLSRWPITESDVRYFCGELDMEHPRMPFDPASWAVTARNLQHVAIHSPGGDLNVYNFQGVWDLDGDNASPERQNMVEAILDATSGKQHVIVAGDTNAKHTNPAMRRLETPFTNVLGDSITTSFNMRRKENPGYATAVVDMIYVSNDFHILEGRCPDVDISDHLPLVATLEMIENKE